MQHSPNERGRKRQRAREKERDNPREAREPEGERTKLVQEKRPYPNCQKENPVPCPCLCPYVTKVMFHDIHGDSDSCQPEVLVAYLCTSIWTTTTGWQLEAQRRRGEGRSRAKACQSNYDLDPDPPECCYPTDIKGLLSFSRSPITTTWLYHMSSTRIG